MSRAWRGAAVAIVTNLNDPQQEGRIKVQLPWLDDDAESHWARMATTQGGATRGNFIRPEVGDEVIVMFEQCDPTQPVVLGVLWNGQDAPPGPGVEGGKNDHKWFQSRSGHKLVFNDGSDGGWIGIDDQSGKLHTKIDVPGQKISFTADTGQIKIVAPKGTVGFECTNFSLSSDDGTNQQITEKSEVEVGNQRTVQVTGTLQQTSGNSWNIETPNYSLTASTMAVNAGGASISSGSAELKVTPQLAVDYQGPVTRNIQQAKFQVQQFRTSADGAPSGPMMINSAQLKINGQGAMALLSGGPVEIKATTVNLMGSSITIAKDKGELGRGTGMGSAQKLGFLGGLMMLNPSPIMMPATKMLDVMMGMDAHTTGIAPIPPPSGPWPPIPLFPHTFVGPILLDVRLSILTNFRPTAGSGATALSFHVPPLPWLPVPRTYRSMMVAAFMALFMGPVSAAISSVSGMIDALKKGENPMSVLRVEGDAAATAHMWFMRSFPMFGSPGAFLAMLSQLAPFPIASGSITIASPTVQAGDTPMGLSMLPFANSCSDIPIIPNAAVLTFSNVMVGVDLSAVLEQMAWNAVHGAVGYAVGSGVNRAMNNRPNNIQAGMNPRLRNAEGAIGDIRRSNLAHCVGDPVDVVSGSLLDTQEDVSLPGPMPLVFERHYNSRAAGNGLGGALGKGWRHSFETYLTRHRREGTEAGTENSSFWVLHTASMGLVELPWIPESEPGGWRYEPVNGLEICRAGDHTWDVTDETGVIHRFVEVDPTVQARTGRLAAIIDPHGNTIQVHHDRDDGHVSHLIDSTGRRVRFEYEGEAPDARLVRLWSEGRPGRLEGAPLRAWRYDEDTLLAATAGPDGHETRYQYDGNGRLSKKLLPGGYAFYFHYDQGDRVTRTYGEDLRYHNALDYEPIAGVTRVEDAAGHVTTYRFDEQRRVTEVIDPMGGITEYEYDDAGRVTSHKNPEGQTTETTYDDRGRVLTRSLPTGGTHTYTYDDRGWLIEESDPCGAITRYTLDARGNRIRTRLPDGSEHLKRFDRQGRVIAELTPDGGEHSYVFDEGGDLVKEAHDGSGLSHRYDSLGRRLSTADDSGSEVRFERDTGGRIIKRLDPDGRSVEWTYDPEGHLVSMRDEDLQTWRYSHDEVGRLTTLITPTGRVRRSQRGLHGQYECHHLGQSEDYAYRYDARGHLTRHQTPDEVAILTTCDALGRAKRSRTSDGREVKFTYGGAEDPILRQTGRGVRQTFRYDALGRCLEAIEVPPDVPLRAEPLPGETPRPVPGEIKVAMTRAPHGPVTEEVGPYGRIRRTFGPGSHLIRGDIDGARYGVQRDERGQPRKVEWPDGSVWKLEPGEAGAVTAFSPEGAIFARDTAGWSVRDAGGRPSAAYAVETDGLGRQVRASMRAGARLPAYTHVWTYDADRRLAEDYDEAGNRLVAGLRYGGGHRLVATPGGAVGYDPCGRVTSRPMGEGDQRFWWDEFDRLAEVDQPDGTVVRYRYDALGRLIEREVDPLYGPTEVWRLFWDEDRLAGELRPDGTEVRYLRIDAEAFTPFAMWITPAGSEDGQLYLLMPDGRGAVVAAVDPEGEVAWLGEYSAYGECSAVERGVDVRLRLMGMWADPLTGVHYNRHRWYVPEWGRYLTPDPLGITGGDNRYVYADGDPIHRVDPLGLAGCKGSDGGKRPPLGEMTTHPTRPGAKTHPNDPPGTYRDANGALRLSKTGQFMAEPSSTGMPAAGSLDNEQTRIWYKSQLAEIPDRLDQSLPLEDRAVQAFEMRNDIKLQARELMSDRAAADALPPPRTLEDVIQRAQDSGATGDDVWRYVLRGSGKSNPGVDKALGL